MAKPSWRGDYGRFAEPPPLPALPAASPRPALPKPNQLLAKLRAGELPIGHMIWEFASRGMARVVAQSGVDFVVLDMEHGGLTIDTIWDQLSFFRAVETTVVVRIPDAEYSFVARCLDAGVQGIMCPNVRTMEQVEILAQALLYPPEGDRGMGLGQAHTDLRATDEPLRYALAANRNNLLITQIESAEAIEIIDEIGAHPAVDVLWVGHMDLSARLGITGCAATSPTSRRVSSPLPAV